MVADAAVVLRRLLENAYDLWGAFVTHAQPRDEGEGGGAVRAGRRVGGLQSEPGEPAAVGDLAGEPPERAERTSQPQGGLAVTVAGGVLDRGPHVGALGGQPL
jgi:hypothetical protein